MSEYIFNFFNFSSDVSVKKTLVVFFMKIRCGI